MDARSWCGIVIGLGVVLAGSGCEQAPDDTAPILIGHFASMTGSEATWGVSTDQGVRMEIGRAHV